MKRKFTHIRSGRIAVAVVTLAAGCLIAACGSASSSSSSTSTSTASASSSGSSSAAGGGAAGSAQRTKLVACLKSHGVTLPSRPPGSGPPPGGSAGGGGTGTGTGTSTTPRRNFFFGGGGGARNLSPKMQAAFKACGAQFGFRGGAGGRGFRGRLSHTAITKYVTCVRQHGYNLPNPNFSGKGPIFPANIQSNAKFQAASKACQSLLTPPRPSGGTSTTSGA